MGPTSGLARPCGSRFFFLAWSRSFSLSSSRDLWLPSFSYFVFLFNPVKIPRELSFEGMVWVQSISYLLSFTSLSNSPSPPHQNSPDHFLGIRLSISPPNLHFLALDIDSRNLYEYEASLQLFYHQLFWISFFICAFPQGSSKSKALKRGEPARKQ